MVSSYLLQQTRLKLMDKLSPPVAFCHHLLSFYFDLSVLSTVSCPFKPHAVSLFLILSLMLTISTSLWLSLRSASQGCRDWRDKTCAHTHYIIWSVYIPCSFWSFPFRVPKLNYAALHQPEWRVCVCVIRSLVYWTCWRREGEGKQRCWLNNVKPVSFCVHFYFYLKSRHYKPMSQHATVLCLVYLKHDKTKKDVFLFILKPKDLQDY